MNTQSNSTANAVLENFRRLPVAVRRDLLKQLIDAVDLPVEAVPAEAQTNGTSKTEMLSAENEAEFKLPMTPRFVRRTGSSKDRAQEFAWVAQHRDEYAGQWVALKGEQLIAHHIELKVVRRAAAEAGMADDAILLFIESSDALPLVGF